MAYEPQKKDPITSYGILLFYIDDHNKIWYLLAQRRDSIEYADFIRGRYAYNNLDTYVQLMTNEERERILKYTFDQLWDDLWVNHDNKVYREVKPKARVKYETHKEYIFKLINTTISNRTEPSWGFPKGKKHSWESDIDCSFREFREETKLSIDYLNLISIPPLVEIFKGSNGKLYRTIYYVAQSSIMIPIKKMRTSGFRSETVSEEISNLEWLQLEDAQKKIPPWRQNMLSEGDEKIREYLRTTLKFTHEMRLKKI